jgi:hypothetical protein
MHASAINVLIAQIVDQIKILPHAAIAAFAQPFCHASTVSELSP